MIEKNFDIHTMLLRIEVIKLGHRDIGNVEKKTSHMNEFIY